MLLEKLKGAAPRLMDASTLSPPTPGQVPEFFILFLFLLKQIFFGRLECVGHSFADVAHFVDVWIRTQRASVASRRAANLATHLPA